MDFNGFDAQMKMRCNFSSAFASANEPKDLELTVGEPLQRRAFDPLPTASKRFDDPGGDFLAHIGSPGQNLADGLHQFLTALLLHDVAAATGAQDAFGIKSFIVHGNHENRQPRMQRLDVLDKFKATFIGQTDIRQHEVGLV